MARPIEYDRNAVLEQAMHVFWSTGYCGTSMNQLVESTGLKPGSLYGAFQSKEQLFIAALECYGQRTVAVVDAMLQSAASPMAGIRNFIDWIVADVTSRTSHGCLLVNTTLELSAQNGTVRAMVNGYFEAIRERLANSLQQARDIGELSTDKNPQELSMMLICMVWGLRVMGETNPSPVQLAMIKRQLLALLA